MFLVHVAPLSKTSPGRLSYFSPKRIPTGALVTVPVRTKDVPALVLSSESAKHVKSLLRTQKYQTRKIPAQKPRTIISEAFVRAAERTATHAATATGSILHAYTPAAIVRAGVAGTLTTPRARKEQQHESRFEELVLQLPRHERIEKYKTIIRGRFAHKQSVLLMVPTAHEARYLASKYERGIEQYTFVLDSTLSAKRQVETWQQALAEPHPVLIIATPTFMSIPRSDIGMCIIEHELSSSYKQQVRPYADARILLEHLARECAITLVYAGTVVSMRTLERLYHGNAHELEEHARTLRVSSSVVTVDLKAERASAKEHNRSFPVLSDASLAALSSALDAGEQAFVFAARRGIASHTVCNDCAATVTCNHCGAPAVLHGAEGARALLCHRCGASRDAHETCAHCGSWNLVSLGIGIERVVEYLNTHLDGARVYVLSSDVAKNAAQARSIIDAFSHTPGSVLVGTEMALPYVDAVSVTVMSSIDSLLCVPDFRIEEKLFGVIALLRERTQKTLYIETTATHNAMLKHAHTGAIATYAREELALRKQLGYPPYTRLIKISCSGTRTSVIAAMQSVVALLERYSPRVFSNILATKKGHVLHALIRVPEDAWPDAELIDILRSLRPSCAVNVDPERTL